MSRDPNDVVRVFAGPLVEVETYQQVLTEAGIESKVVGTELTASFGTALPDSIELWVHRRDAEKAAAAIEATKSRRWRHEGAASATPHPTDSPKPPRPRAEGAARQAGPAGGVNSEHEIEPKGPGPGVLAPRPASGRSLQRSFSAFTGRSLTTVEAGLSLVTYSVPVSRLIFFSPPLTASFRVTVTRHRPGNTNLPGPLRPTCVLITSTISSRTVSTCFFVMLGLVGEVGDELRLGHRLLAGRLLRPAWGALAMMQTPDRGEEWLETA